MQIHGWPDLSMGWRYQIPLLVDMGFRVVAPDMMGYGGTVSVVLSQSALDETKALISARPFGASKPKGIHEAKSKGQDAPKVPPSPISLYGLKRASDDIAALAKEVGASRIILGGHDWCVDPICLYYSCVC